MTLAAPLNAAVGQVGSCRVGVVHEWIALRLIKVGKDGTGVDQGPCWIGSQNWRLLVIG